MLELLLLAHFSSCLFMSGLIWLVQLVHYPGFSLVGEDVFESYQAFHISRIGFVVMPVMLLEVATAIGLWFNSPSQNWLFYLNLALLVLIWLSTFLVQVPLHQQLESSLKPDVVQALVNTNWLRTAAWTARSVVLGCIVYVALVK